jgi:hypothetical protein
MFDKISNVIGKDRKTVMRRARILGGVVCGIAIGLLLDKEVEEPDFIIMGKIVPVEPEEYGTDDDTSSDEDPAQLEQ